MKAGRMYYTNGVRDRESEARQEGFEIGIEQGKAEGRKEVVDWIKSQEYDFHRGFSGRIMMDVSIMEQEWLVKLKEWAIEE